MDELQSFKITRSILIATCLSGALCVGILEASRPKISSPPVVAEHVTPEIEIPDSIRDELMPIDKNGDVKLHILDYVFTLPFDNLAKIGFTTYPLWDICNRNQKYEYTGNLKTIYNNKYLLKCIFKDKISNHNIYYLSFGIVWSQFEYQNYIFAPPFNMQSTTFPFPKEDRVPAKNRLGEVIGNPSRPPLLNFSIKIHKKPFPEDPFDEFIDLRKRDDNEKKYGLENKKYEIFDSGKIYSGEKTHFHQDIVIKNEARLFTAKRNAEIHCYWGNFYDIPESDEQAKNNDCVEQLVMENDEAAIELKISWNGYLFEPDQWKIFDNIAYILGKRIFKTTNGEEFQ